MMDRARFERTTLILGALGLAVCALGAIVAGGDAFSHSYLVGVLFWVEIAVGCLGIHMLHGLTGGGWGVFARRILHGSSSTMPVAGLLFVPVLLGLTKLYPWARADVMAHDPIVGHKAAYLNPTFFIVRTVIYFAVWSGLALTLFHRAKSRAGKERASRRMRMIAGPGLVAAALTLTFAAIDWVMSLDPHWYSTLFGALIIVGSLLSGMAFTIIAVVTFTREDEIPIDRLHDLGNLLLVFVMLWAYLSFSQYLIIYSGNTAEDVPFYVHRTEGGWQHLALALIVCHFAMPFSVLITRKTKRSPQALRAVAVFILFMRLVELFWFVAPNFYGEDLHIHWLDVAAPIGVGGIWLFWFSRRLRAFATPAADATRPAAGGAT